VEYRIRSYEDRDAPAVAECLTSGAALDDTLLPIDENEWRLYSGREFNNGARDFMVAERGGAIFGVLMSTRMEQDGEWLRSFRIIVHPDHRRRGIATRIMEQVELQDPDGDTTLRAGLQGKWTAGKCLLEKHGFEVVERFLWMRADAERNHRAPDAPPPEGFALRPYRADDADDSAWRRLNREAYEGTSDYMDLVAAECEAARRTPRFHLWIAEHGDEPVGFCLTNAFSGKNRVESIVVAAKYRGRGLGRALLVAGLRTLRSEEPGGVWLSVRADNAHAVALYESVGFIIEDESIDWWKRRD